MRNTQIEYTVDERQISQNGHIVDTTFGTLIGHSDKPYMSKECHRASHRTRLRKRNNGTDACSCTGYGLKARWGMTLKVEIITFPERAALCKAVPPASSSASTSTARIKSSLRAEICPSCVAPCRAVLPKVSIASS